MRRRRALQLTGLAVLLLLTLAVNLPYRAWLEAKLKADLADAGFSQLDFHVSDVTARSITLSDVTLAGQKLESLTVGYGPIEIMQGNFRNLSARNMALRQGQMTVSLSEVVLNISPDAQKKHWTGPWQVKAIRVENTPVVIAPLTGEGTLTRDGSDLQLEGKIVSADKQFFAAFRLDYDSDDSSKTKLTLNPVRVPWNGGLLRVDKLLVPLFSTAPIRMLLEADKVSLDMLMAGATDKKATATGTISGSVPVTVARDGSFTLQAGTLKADSTGTLTLSPDLIPGDNAQVQMVRDVLQDFHYSLFSMGVEKGDSKTLSILLSLQGNNPQVYNGRQINLNVHLTGDVIELLTQSAMMLNDPQQLLEQNHAK